MLEGVADRIAAIIDAVGRDVLIRTLTATGTSYDPTLTPSDVTARAAIVQFKAKGSNADLVQADDKKVFISSTTEVTKQNKIVDGLIVYQIVELRLVQPGDSTFLYIAQCRK